MTKPKPAPHRRRVSAPVSPLDPDRLKVESPLAYELMKFIRKYVVMSRPELMVVSLWIVHTHCVGLFEQTPYLAVTSPEKQCGKSRLLDVLALLVLRPWLTVLPSEAVVYRYIEEAHPTLLLDEVDTIFNPRSGDKYEGLRALLNSGHRRGAKVPRCVGNTNEIAEFSTFCPKVLAGIGMLPDTVADRSIPIRLQRKTREEKVSPFRLHIVEPGSEPLRDRIVEWVEANRESLADVHPAMPAELSDRMQEGCECLVVIADKLGCGEGAREALVALFTAERLDDAESARLRLLRDVRAAFGDKTRLSTADLLAALHADDEGPWGSYYGRGLDARDLSTLLHHFGIAPTTVAIAGQRAKGYKKEDFHVAWSRYVR